MANPDNVEWTYKLACDVVKEPPPLFHSDTIIDAWNYLIEGGFVWSLSGWFQMRAADLIAAGICPPTKKFWKRDVPEDFPPEYLAQHNVSSPTVKGIIKSLEKEAENAKQTKPK